jgi:hypothetical protein
MCRHYIFKHELAEKGTGGEIYTSPFLNKKILNNDFLRCFPKLLS